MFSRVTLLLLQALLYACVTQAEANSTLNMTETLNILFHGYDKFTPPALSGGEDNGPISVNICVNIKDVFDISALHSSFSVRDYFTLQWHDERLRYSPYLKNEKLMERIRVPVGRIQESGEWQFCYIRYNFFLLWKIKSISLDSILIQIQQESLPVGCVPPTCQSCVFQELPLGVSTGKG